MPTIGLGNLAVQVLRTHLVVSPHDPALQRAQWDSTLFVWTSPRTYSPVP